MATTCDRPDAAARRRCGVMTSILRSFLVNAIQGISLVLANCYIPCRNLIPIFSRMAGDAMGIPRWADMKVTTWPLTCRLLT